MTQLISSMLELVTYSRKFDDFLGWFIPYIAGLCSFALRRVVPRRRLGDAVENGSCDAL